MFEFEEIVKSDRKLSAELIHGRPVNPYEVKAMIDSALQNSHRITYIEDLQDLQIVLRFWAGYLSSLGESLPDIDLSTPERRPQNLQVRPDPNTSPPESSQGEGRSNNKLNLEEMSEQLTKFGDRITRLEHKIDEIEDGAAATRRDRFSIKLLSLAMVYEQESDQLLVCQLKQGEFGGQWQFPGGYVDPSDPTTSGKYRLKAEAEINKVLKINPTQELFFKGSVNEDSQPFAITYSNRGRNLAMIYEYLAPKSVIQSAIASSRLPGRIPCHLVNYKNIEAERLRLEEQIAVFVYEILEQYKGVKYSSEFKAKLEQIKIERIERNKELPLEMQKAASEIKEIVSDAELFEADIIEANGDLAS